MFIEPVPLSLTLRARYSVELTDAALPAGQFVGLAPAPARRRSLSALVQSGLAATQRSLGHFVLLERSTRLVVATAESRAELERDWAYAVERVAPALAVMEATDRALFVRDKFALLAQTAEADEVVVSDSKASEASGSKASEASGSKASEGDDGELLEVRAVAAIDEVDGGDGGGEADDGGDDESLAHDMDLRLHEQFAAVPADERLVAYFACMFWIGATPTPTWLLVSDNFVAFLPKFYKRRHKALVELAQVAAIDNQASKTAIVVRTKDGASYSFTALRRGTVYRVLEQLWSAAMARVLRRAERSSALIEAQWARQQRRARRQRTNSIVADNLSGATDANQAAAAASAAADAMRFSSDTGSTTTVGDEAGSVPGDVDELDGTTLESLELEREQSHFVRLFRLPRDEPLLGHFKSARFALRRFDEDELQRRADERAGLAISSPKLTKASSSKQVPASLVRGHVWLGANFLAFASNDKCLLVCIPLVSASKLNQRVRLVGGGAPIRVVVRGGEDLIFSVRSDEEYKAVHDQWRKCNEYRRSSALSNSADASAIEQAPKHLPESLLNDSSQFSAEFGAKDAAQRRKWHRYVTAYGSGVAMARTPELRTLVRAGLPNDMRARAWELLSGAAYKRELQPDLYERLVADEQARSERERGGGGDVAQSSESADTGAGDGDDSADGSTDSAAKDVREEIENDLHRSLPEHEWFQSDEGIGALRRVLLAYACFNPEIGYCQSMNIVTAMLLSFMDEPAAFFTLSTIVEGLVPEYYRRSMVGSNVDQRVFAELVDTTFPTLSAHLEKIGLPIIICSLPWFLCFYISYVPMEVALRILDCFFLEGPKVLFQVGLALFSLHRTSMLASDDPVTVRQKLRDPIDPNVLLELAFGEFGDLPNERIRAMRARHRFETIKDLQEKNKKTQFRDLQRVSDFSRDELETYYAAFDAVLGDADTGGALSLERFEMLFGQFLPWWAYRVPAVPVDLVLKTLDVRVRGHIDLREFVSLMSLLTRPASKPDDTLKFCFRLYEAGVNYLDRRRFEQALQLLRVIVEQANVDNLTESVDIDAVWRELVGDDGTELHYAQFRNVINTKTAADYFGLGSAPTDDADSSANAVASSTNAADSSTNAVVDKSDESVQIEADDQAQAQTDVLFADLEALSPRNNSASDSSTVQQGAAAASDKLVDIDDLLS